MATFKWEEAAGRMIVAPQGYEETQILLKLPSRRWRKMKSDFVVPTTRMNAKLLLDAGWGYMMSVPLRKHLEEIVHASKHNRTFPSWYRFQDFTIGGEYFTGQPLPDQRNAIEKLYPMNCGALLMPMGVGKSKALIDIVTAHYLERRINCVVLAAPLTTVGVWTGKGGQLDLHSPVKTLRVHADSSLDWTKWRPKADELMWVTVGLESLSAGKTASKLKALIQNNKVAIAVDESHWIKNHSAIRTKNIIDLRKSAVLAYIMTGTPATNQLIDLYAQFEFLDPNIIGVGDYYAFRNRYCVMGGYKNKEIVGYDHTDELMGLIEPYTYICDVPKGLPEQRWTKRPVRMHPEQFEMYQKVRQAKIESISVKNVLNKVLRLSQIAGGFLYEDPELYIDPISGKEKKARGKLIWSLPPEKNPKLLDLLDQVQQEPDRQFVIWARFTFEIDMLVAALKKLGPTAQMTGATPDEERPKVVADFQQGKYRYLVANPQIGGVSWTMTAATRGYYYSNTLKYDDRAQSEKRIHRQGQKHNVLYTDFEMLTPRGAQTTDGLVLAALAAKQDLDAFIKKRLKDLGTKIEDLY